MGKESGGLATGQLSLAAILDENALADVIGPKVVYGPHSVCMLLSPFTFLPQVLSRFRKRVIQTRQARPHDSSSFRRAAASP